MKLHPFSSVVSSFQTDWWLGLHVFTLPTSLSLKIKKKFTTVLSVKICINKEENVHRFALSAISKELLERDSFGILYTGYLLFLVKIKRERERERERE